MFPDSPGSESGPSKTTFICRLPVGVMHDSLKEIRYEASEGNVTLKYDYDIQLRRTKTHGLIFLFLWVT